MRLPFRHAARSWWWRRFHPFTRIGWNAATVGKNRTALQTVLGLGLIAYGLMLRNPRGRTVLYSRSLEGGSVTRIKVYRGKQTIYDGTPGG